jgi:hypothetical protein
MPRKNRPPDHRVPQHGRGKNRPQGQHKKQRSEGVAKAIRDLEARPWYRREDAA